MGKFASQRIKGIKSTMEACIFIDWGTTNARSYLIEDGGAIRNCRHTDLGILNVRVQGFPRALQELTADWLDADGNRLPVFMSGMIGSRQGWAEAPYAHCPATPADLAASVMAVPDIENVWIVPGVCLPPDGPRRDVMRGEEVQIFGALEITGRETATLCLPGTHSKWARAEGGKLVDFATAMTGEVFQVMRMHSILGKLMSDGTVHQSKAFARGLDASGTDGGLLNHLFRVRADGLFGITADDEQASYLSGMLIGHEIRDLADTYPADSDDVLLVGSSSLAKIYEEAFSHLEVPFQTIDSEKATINGLTSIWNSRH